MRRGKRREERGEDMVSYPVCSTQHTVGCPRMLGCVHWVAPGRLPLCVVFCRKSLEFIMKFASLFLYTLELEADFLK